MGRRALRTGDLVEPTLPAVILWANTKVSSFETESTLIDSGSLGIIIGIDRFNYAQENKKRIMRAVCVMSCTTGHIGWCNADLMRRARK